MENKLRRETKQIADDISETLKVIDDLSIDIGQSATNKQKIVLDFGALKKLWKAASGIRNDIGFFLEGKRLGLEILEKAKKNYDSLKQDEKEKILKFVNESYEKEKYMEKDFINLDQEKFIRILTDFDNDIDKYIEKLNQKLTELEENIHKEEDKQSELRRDILKEDAEFGEKKLAVIEKNKKIFNQEMEKLDILEEELSLAIMDKDNQKQIEDMRSFLDKKIS